MGMTHIAVAIILGAAIALPASAATEAKVVSVEGICDELRLDGRNLVCDRLLTIHAARSRRYTFVMVTATDSIKLTGSRQSQLAPEVHQLLVETVMVRGTQYSATGQCKATVRRDTGAVRFLDCEAGYAGGEIRVRFRAIGKSSEGL